MNKAITLAFIAAIAFTAASANAASVSGVVASVDRTHDAIRLTDGSVFTLAEGTEAEDFKPGTKVKIAYTKKHGGNLASSVKVEN